MIQLQKSAIKAWSTWGITLLIVLEWAKANWPTLEGQIPQPLYEYGTLGLAVLVLAVRFINQGLSYRDR